MKPHAFLMLPALALAACQSEPRRPAVNQTPSFYLSMASADAVVDSAAARDMISVYRRNKGLGPLAIDPDLQAAAEAEAKAMAAADRPSSADAFKARLASAGFKAPAANVSAGSARAISICVAITVAPSSAVDLASAPITPSTSLSIIDATTSVSGPGARNGRRSSSAC